MGDVRQHCGPHWNSIHLVSLTYCSTIISFAYMWRYTNICILNMIYTCIHIPLSGTAVSVWASSTFKHAKPISINEQLVSFALPIPGYSLSSVLHKLARWCSLLHRWFKLLLGVRRSTCRMNELHKYTGQKRRYVAWNNQKTIRSFGSLTGVGK